MPVDTPAVERLRVDKWLWHVRMTKTRSQAARLVEAGFVRVNSVRVTDPAKPVKVGDVLTIALEHAVKVVEILGLGSRRGPAVEARTLYRDVDSDGS